MKAKLINEDRKYPEYLDISPPVDIVGVIIRELNKSDSPLSVNSIGDQVWFTQKKNGRTLKMKIIDNGK